MLAVVPVNDQQKIYSYTCKLSFMFDRDLLRALRSVVELGTVTAAAERLRLTPSGVSQQLARLQRQSGLELLVRRGRYLHPTEAARVLVQAAVEMEVVDASARARLEELQGTPAGQVAIAAFPSACRGLMGPVTTELARTYPKVSLVVREAYPEEGVDKALSGEVDMAVVHEWEQVPLAIPLGLSAHVLGTDEVDLIVPSDHPAAGRETISIADLPGERWITDTTQIYARWLQQSLDSARIPYTMSGLVNEHESQINLTAHGLGFSIVPRLGRTRLSEGVRAVSLRERTPQRRLIRVERKDSIDRPALNVVRHTLDVQAQVVLEELKRG